MTDREDVVVALAKNFAMCWAEGDYDLPRLEAAGLAKLVSEGRAFQHELTPLGVAALELGLAALEIAQKKPGAP